MKNNFKLGLRLLTVLAAPLVVNEVASSEVQATTGWVQNGNVWYYYNAQGQMVRNAWVGNYWLGADGKMVTNAWVDGNKYYVGNNGAWVKNAQNPTQVKTGWVQSGNTWYHYNDRGVLTRNAWIGNYWLGADGKMATNAWVDNNKYYVGSNGEWVPNAQKSTVKLGWVKNGTTWYHYKTNGALTRGAWVGNYWLGADGKMATNAWIDNNKYYVGSNGAWVKNAQNPTQVKTGWVQSENIWYHYNNQGALTRNAWVGNYWLGADGKMATNAWVDNNKYYVGANGAWVKDAKITNNNNAKRVIFLDPGHGGSDSGAVQNGVREKDLNMSIYNKVNSRLAELGFTVLTSRNNDKYVDLVERAVQANNAKADMLVSIHFNAGGRGQAQGIETYYYQPRAERTPTVNKDNHTNATRLENSKKLAQKVQKNLLYQTGAQDRGVKRESFTVLRETAVPSILVELGFLDNVSEVNKIKTNAYQDKLAQGIVDGITEYYK